MYIYICTYIYIYMGGSIKGVPPNWLVYSGKSCLEMDDFGVPLFQETSIYVYTQMYITV